MISVKHLKISGENAAQITLLETHVYINILVSTLSRYHASLYKDENFKFAVNDDDTDYSFYETFEEALEAGKKLAQDKAAAIIENLKDYMEQVNKL